MLQLDSGDEVSLQSSYISPSARMTDISFCVSLNYVLDDTPWLCSQISMQPEGEGGCQYIRRNMVDFATPMESFNFKYCHISICPKIVDLGNSFVGNWFFNKVFLRIWASCRHTSHKCWKWQNPLLKRVTRIYEVLTPTFTFLVGILPSSTLVKKKHPV